LDIGHRTRKWFYILSNAAIHSIGQTKIFQLFSVTAELVAANNVCQDES